MSFASRKRRPRWEAKRSELSVPGFKDGFFRFRGGPWLDKAI